MKYCRHRKTFITFCNCTKVNVTFVHMKANTLLLLLLLCNHNYRQDDGLKKIRPQDKSSFQRDRERSRSVQVIVWVRARKTFTAGRLLAHTDRREVCDQDSLIAAYMQTSRINTWTDGTHTAHGFVHFLLKRSKYLVIYVILNSCYSGQTTGLEPKRCSHEELLHLNLNLLGNQGCWGYSNFARQWNVLLFVLCSK